MLDLPIIFYFIGAAIVVKLFFHKRFFYLAALLFICFYMGLYLWDTNIYDSNSEIVVYYLPMLSIEESLDTHTYDGMPLFFYFARNMMKLTNMTAESIIIYLRFLLYATTIYASIHFWNSINLNVPKKIMANNSHYIAVFLSLDYTFTFLTVSDQFKQFLGMPFYIFMLASLVKRKNIPTAIFSCIAMFSHHLYIPLILLTLFIYFISNRRVLCKINVLLVVPLLIFASVITLQYLIVDVDYWADRIRYTVPIGVFDSYINAPGAIAAVTYYICIFISFKYVCGLFFNKDITFVILLPWILFLFSKLNVIGVAFVEPARLYAMMSPFVAIMAAYIFIKINRLFRILFLAMYISYNFIMTYISSLHSNVSLDVLNLPLSEHYSHIYNSDSKLIMLLFATISIFFIIKFIVYSAKFSFSHRAG